MLPKRSKSERARAGVKPSKPAYHHYQKHAKKPKKSKKKKSFGRALLGEIFDVIEDIID